MQKIDSEVLIKAGNSIPIEIHKAAMTWQDIIISNMPFIVTIFVVLGSAAVTFFISRKSIAAQERQSAISRKAEHENKISEFRHKWLQDLRETAAELSKSLHLCQLYNLQRNCSVEYRNSAERSGNEKSFLAHQEDAAKHYQNFLDARGDFYKLSAKIKMFFKLGDNQASKLFELLEKARNEMGDSSTCLNDELIEDIVSELRIILKNEWEVTKDRKWVKNT